MSAVPLPRCCMTVNDVLSKSDFIYTNGENDSVCERERKSDRRNGPIHITHQYSRGVAVAASKTHASARVFASC